MLFRSYCSSAKEAVLKTNLREIRSALEQYLGDKGHYPQQLSDLVPRYLKIIPMDPFTKSNQAWVPVYEDQDENDQSYVPGPLPGEGGGDDEEQGPGIQDIHSSSTDTALDGTKYADW